MFDFDHTLVIPKSFNQFPKSYDDFEYLFSKIPQILKKFLKNDFKIVIISNQHGVSLKHTTAEVVTNRVL